MARAAKRRSRPPVPQIIMVRLQRVTFLALHNYLGLTTELFNPVSGRGAPAVRGDLGAMVSPGPELHAPGPCAQ